MKDEHLRGELLQTEEGRPKAAGQAADEPEASAEGRRGKDTGRRAEAAGDVQEVLFGEPPGAEDDADGII
jgi:hypothetical protein